MFDKIIVYSIQNKLVVGLFVMALIVWGLFSLRQLPIDAVPDITNNQVQVITTSPTLATQEVEQFITTPIELALQNIQQLVEIRSISRFGLSVVTVVFEEKMDIYLARQLVSEYLIQATENIPDGFGRPEMAPISTGLGEIYQYLIKPLPDYEEQYSVTDLRSIQDWIVKRQLAGIEGVIEVNTLGGFLKQYEVAILPDQLKSMGISINEVFAALQNSNENTGGAYIEKNPNTYFIRTDGLSKSLEDIGNTVVKTIAGTPILVSDIATVQLGQAPRYGAVTSGGREVVSGTVMMLKGANSAAVTQRVKERITQIQQSLPEGVVIEPFLVRDKLITTAITTVKTNLLEGGLIVVFILVLMLGNWRAGLIVASVIPLSMLFAVSLMKVFGISANLMSLGAIDFGLIVDGAVIMVEAVVHRLNIKHGGQRLTAVQMDQAVATASMKIRNSAAFGEIIILMVYLPILALVGIEGKMFRPMAQTVMLAIGGALILSMTYVPMMAALFLNKTINSDKTIADRIIAFFQKLYTPVLNLALRFKLVIVALVIGLFIFSFSVFTQLGGAFIPTLEEGDLALHQILIPGSSLAQSVEVSKVIQKKLTEEFPEIEKIVTKIGSAEIPTDPMPIETGDIMLIMKPKSEWITAKTRQGMFEKLEASLQEIPGVAYEFSQPIQMRFNELMTGSRADIAIKLYGEDLDVLYTNAKMAEGIINQIEGVGSIKVEQTVGMPQIIVNFKYDKMAQYGIQVKTVNQVIRMAFAGERVSTIYEGDRRYDLVVRLAEKDRNNWSQIADLFIPLTNGQQVPVSAVAEVSFTDAPMQISRENTNRSIVIGVNVGDKDVESLVEEIQMALNNNIKLPVGYYFTYGGQFENLRAAKKRLSVAVPIALALIFILLFFTFHSFWQAVLIFTAIPLSAIGGIWALVWRDMPFSISAGIGFIALFGVAVLNGIVLIGYFNELKKEGMTDIRQRIIIGTKVRLRPVLMTAMVASFGFLPMALSNSGGAEVQRPLATVVIGGLVSATFLTLVIMPILYSWLATWQEQKNKLNGGELLILLPFVFFTCQVSGQPTVLSIDQAMDMAIKNSPDLKVATLQIEQSQSLQGMKYSPGNTTLNYKGDALFRRNGNRSNQLEIAQYFPSPAITKAGNFRQKELVSEHHLAAQYTATELKLAVRNFYIKLQQKKQLRKTYMVSVGQLERFYQVATARVKAGEANNLEKLTVEAILNEQRFLQQQQIQAIENLERQFQFLLQTEEPVTTIDTLMMEQLIINDTSGIPLILQMANQHIRIEESEIDILRATTKPGFSLGYAAQKFFDENWLTGLQAGIQVPLFNRQTKQKIKAQQIQVAVAQAQLTQKQFDYQQRIMTIQNTMKQYQAGATFYQQQLNDLTPEIERVAQLNYRAGQLSYLELLNILKLKITNQQTYWDQVLAYHEALVFYQFLTNQ